MPESTHFVPTWASAPGETVSDLLEERSLSAPELGQLLSLSTAEMNALLAGEAEIGDSMARQLSQLLGASESFWKSREVQYRADRARSDRLEREWLSNLPVRDMVNFGWINFESDSHEKAEACKRFFGVTDTTEWLARYSTLLDAAAFHASTAFGASMPSVATWLRQGELEAKSIECRPWDPEAFERALAGIRSLTREKNPSIFLPQLQAICADAGVAVVIVRTPKQCPASGATWFISPECAVLQLSFRFLTDDHFWFTFFHEAGHLLLHSEHLSPLPGRYGAHRWILEEAALDDSEWLEREANEFAYHTLIPEETEHRLMNLVLKKRDVMSYAREIGVSPGIVVGQLQHNGTLRYNQLNGLKRRYKWSEQATISRRIS